MWWSAGGGMVCKRLGGPQGVGWFVGGGVVCRRWKESQPMFHDLLNGAYCLTKIQKII